MAYALSFPSLLISLAHSLNVLLGAIQMLLKSVMHNSINCGVVLPYIKDILPKGPYRHAYTWQIGPFWQDTLDIKAALGWHCFG